MNVNSTKQSMSRVRLRRKFNHRPRFDYIQQLVMIIRMQIIFELIVMLLVCGLKLSLDINAKDMFVFQFWTDDAAYVRDNNVAVVVGLVVLCPYMILIEKTKVNLVKDCYLTVLVFHSIVAYANTEQPSLAYALFIVLIGFVIASITQYLTMVLQQKRLIQQINMIECEDRKSIKFEQSEFASLNTLQLYESK